MQINPPKKNIARSFGPASLLTRGLVVLACLSLCVGFLCSSTFGQEKDRNSRAPVYQSWLWLFDETPASEELFLALDQLGISGTNVAGVASADAHKKSNRPFYIDHVAGKGTLYLKDETFTAPYEAWRKNKKKPGLPRPQNLFDAKVIERAKQRIDQVLAPYASWPTGTGPHALSLDDEISFGRRNIPTEFGHSKESIEAFQDYLRQKYTSIGALNDYWGTRYGSFDKVRPMTTTEIRRREFIKDRRHWNFAPWSEHRDFIDRFFTNKVHELARHARQKLPGKKVGFTGGSYPHPFSGLHWHRVLQKIDFCEPYDVGGNRELIRSFAKPNTLIARTLFQDKRHKDANKHELWDYFLRGDRGVILWSSQTFFKDGNLRHPTPWAEGLKSTLKALRTPQMDEWDQAKPIQPKIAVVESQASMRLHWLIDSMHDGSSWIDRMGRFEEERNGYSLNREAWQKLLEDLHLDYVHIAAEDLYRADLSDFKVLVLPRTVALSAKSRQVIMQFARTKTVIADSACGLFDENLKVNARSEFDEFFGIERTNFDCRCQQKRLVDNKLANANALLLAEPGLVTRKGVASTLRIEQKPCMILKRHGTSGRSVYLNLLTYNYLGSRRSNERSKLLDELRGVFRITGVRPHAEVRSEGVVPPIRLFHRQSKDAEYIAVLRNWRQSVRCATSEQLQNMRPLQVEVLLPRASVIENMLHPNRRNPLGRKYPRRMSSINATLHPFEPLIFKLPRRDDVRNR